MKKAFSVEIDGYEISLYQMEDTSFQVHYGADIRTNLDVLDAALHIGSCLVHALACEGKITYRVFPPR